MCGIIISTEEIDKKSYKFIKNRGPDHINCIEYKNINFVHFLLHLTGEKTTQPLIDYDNEIVVIFNGEIYNYLDIYKDAKSDVYSILKAYQMYSDDFINYLDGEFTIIIIDFKKDKLIISSDIFKTKPLFYNVSKKNIVIASYQSTCKSIIEQEYNEIKPNEILFFSLSDRYLVNKRTIYNFDLNDHKNNYDDYINALEKSIIKRYPKKSIPLITLSSGLDSGAISCCLNKYKKEAYYYSFIKNENYKTLLYRQQILGKNHKFLEINNDEKKYWNNNLVNNCEPFVWDWNYHPKINDISDGFIQGSMLGKCKIIDEVKKQDNNTRILFSGIGADEVMARNQYYSLGYGNVNSFNNLKEQFPWKNFLEGSMYNYLKGDEYVGGCYGFETRYPYCDKDVVQEFLWLSPDLKNSYKNCIYKPPLLYYLELNNFPIWHYKLGFDV